MQFFDTTYLNIHANEFYNDIHVVVVVAMVTSVACN